MENRIKRRTLTLEIQIDALKVHYQKDEVENGSVIVRWLVNMTRVRMILPWSATRVRHNLTILHSVASLDQDDYARRQALSS